MQNVQSQHTAEITGLRADTKAIHAEMKANHAEMKANHKELMEKLSKRWFP